MTHIITARLRLRMFTPRDADAYNAAIHSDPDVMRYMPGGTPRSRARSASLIATIVKWWSAHNYGLWAVESLAGGELIGHCGLMQEPDSGAVEIGYALARAHWGQGLASEGARASLRYGFEQAGLERVIALADPANAASRRVMEKIGMRFEGVTRLYYSGWELALYAIDRQEFTPGGDPYRLVDAAGASRAARPA
jgi:ribosomal-protein-alanine N-acetyltransferase